MIRQFGGMTSATRPAARVQPAVGLCTLPGCWICIWAEKSGQFLIRVKITRTALRFELGIEMVHRPIHDGIRRVIEHLAHDLAADTRIAAAFDFDKRGDGILIQEQIIDSPASPSPLFPRHTSLTRDEQQHARYR